MPAALGSAVTFLYHGGALFCAYTILKNPRLLSREPIVIAMTGAFYLFVAAYLLSNLVNGRWGSIESLLWLWAFVMFPFSYSIWRISDPEVISRTVAMACSVGAISGALFAAVQYFAYHMRAEGGAGNALVFATVMTLAVAISFAGGMRSSGKWWSFHLLAAVAGTAAIIISQSRGIWPALALNIVVAIMVLRRRVSPLSRLQVGGLVLGLASILGLFAWISIPRFGILLDNYESIQNHDFQSSFGLRVLMWEAGIDAWSKSKIFGLGSGSILEVTRNIGPGTVAGSQFTHLHNQFITTMVETGIVGLSALFLVIVIPVVFAFRTMRSAMTAAQEMGVLIIFFVMITFVTSGLTNIMVRQDIMDTVFVTSIIVGLFLCTGYSAVSKSA